MNTSKDMGFRAGVVIVHGNAVLVIHRIKNKKEYYVFPGGTVEKGESKKDAAIRELFEETAIVGKNARLIYQLQINKIPLNNDTLEHKQELLFLCDYISGSPELKEESEEHQRNCRKNYYKPIWFPLDKINQILLYPLEVRDLLERDVHNGFNDNLKKIVIDFKCLRNF